MGKLAKPQRTRKHKKIKAIDPFYVGPRTADRKAALANQPPKKNDEDLVPYKVREFVKLKEKAKTAQNKKSKKRRKKEIQENPASAKMEKGMTRPLKPVPTFRQLKGESDKEFMRRVHNETEAVISMAKYEDKFDVEFCETETGECRQLQRKSEETSEKGIKKMKKKLRLKEKAKEAKETKRQEKLENFEHLKDEVVFGEVAVAPPTLTAKPRKAKEMKTNKPGAKQLLLKSMLQPSQDKPKSTAERPVGQTLKRKYMSIAERRILDVEREKAIAMYRLLKKRKKLEQKPIP